MFSRYSKFESYYICICEIKTLSSLLAYDSYQWANCAGKAVPWKMSTLVLLAAWPELGVSLR